MSCNTCIYQEVDYSPSPFDDDYICKLDGKYLGGDYTCSVKSCEHYIRGVEDEKDS